jgi:AAA domain
MGYRTYKVSKSGREPLLSFICEYSDRLAQESGAPTRLIIIETINRVLAGGDENSSVDMGKLIDMLSQIQLRTGAHVLVVHHSPIEGGRLRGHSSLLGACDTTILVQRSGTTSSAQIDKANDGPTGEQITWTVDSVDLHRDPETGVTTTAPVVVPSASAAPARPQALNERERAMLAILAKADIAGLGVKDWYAQARAAGVGAKRSATLSEAKAALLRRGLILEEDGYCRLRPQ